MSCTHSIERSRWVETDYFGDPIPGEWQYWTESTTEDIDLGRFRCTQCGKVMYYTGLWREHHEGGRKLLDERTGHIK